MNDLQAKFAIALLACGLFFAYAFPKLEQAKHDHDAVIRMVGEVYDTPNPSDPNAPSGNAGVDDLQKYADQKAATRKAQLH
jgi:hypothetical protein